ncbi:MAG TPA: hypothetical protein VK357_17305 [Rubrobacteraceae bacterium]|nr:hypothetical protein [Rubrobacteraceae bacterium]
MRRWNMHPDIDSVVINLRDGDGGVVGEIMGEDLNENVVLHRDDAGTLYEIEVVGSASKVFALERLEVEGLPVGVSATARQESKAG